MNKISTKRDKRNKDKRKKIKTIAVLTEQRKSNQFATKIQSTCIAELNLQALNHILAECFTLDSNCRRVREQTAHGHERKGNRFPKNMLVKQLNLFVIWHYKFGKKWNHLTKQR